MADVALCCMSAAATAAAIRQGRVTAVQAVEYFIARIERLDVALNAVVVRIFDTARARAKAADAALARGEVWGPLHGVPITVKESWHVAGTLSTAGADRTAKSYTATTNAPTVQLLMDAGCIILGKTNMPTSAADFQSYNEYYGTTSNPWDASRTCGGSSGGSAVAMAAGLASLELGTDIGGSIRNPAHFCGAFGHKPTQGLVSMQGVAPRSNHPLVQRDPAPGPDRLDPSFLLHELRVAGPLARSCSDLELSMRLYATGVDLYQARAGYSFALPPPAVTEPSALRAACWSDDPFCPVDSEVARLVEAAARALAGAGAAMDFEVRPVDFAEQHAHFARLLAENYRPEMSHAEYLGIEAQRFRFKQLWMDFFDTERAGGFDVLLCPVMPMAAFPHDHRRSSERTFEINGVVRSDYTLVGTAWCGLTIFPDLPVTVVPVGLTSSGLPCGVQIVSAPWRDLQTIEVGKMLEALGFRFQPPPGYEHRAEDFPAVAPATSATAVSRL